MSSVGMTCCRSLRRHLACHDLKKPLTFGMAHLVKRRSCNERPDSLLVEVAFCNFPASFEPKRVFFDLSRLLSGSDDVPSLPGIAIRLTGSSLLTNTFAVDSSMIHQLIGPYQNMRCHSSVIGYKFMFSI